MKIDRFPTLCGIFRTIDIWIKAVQFFEQKGIFPNTFNILAEFAFVDK